VLRFTNREISWVSVWVVGRSVFLQAIISGLRRLKNVKFGIKVASMWMMHAHSFWNSFLIVAKSSKNTKKARKCEKEQILLHVQKPQIVEMQKLAQT